MTLPATLPLRQSAEAHAVMHTQLQELALAACWRFGVVTDASGNPFVAVGDVAMARAAAPFAPLIAGGHRGATAPVASERVQTWLADVPPDHLRARSLQAGDQTWYLLCAATPTPAREAALFRAASTLRRVLGHR